MLRPGALLHEQIGHCSPTAVTTREFLGCALASTTTLALPEGDRDAPDLRNIGFLPSMDS